MLPSYKQTSIPKCVRFPAELHKNRSYETKLKRTLACWGHTTSDGSWLKLSQRNRNLSTELVQVCSQMTNIHVYAGLIWRNEPRVQLWHTLDFRKEECYTTRHFHAVSVCTALQLYLLTVGSPVTAVFV